MSNQQSDGKSVLNGLMSTVSIAGNGCHQVGTGGGGIVPMLAGKQQQDNGHGYEFRLANTKRDSGAGVVKTCDHCKRLFVAKRPKRARYCGPGCRRAAWLEANPDKKKAIAARDKARLKAHIIANGGAWEDRQAGGGAAGDVTA